MNLLNDKELVDLIRTQGLISKDIVSTTNDYSTDSPIQPSSLDLHIGAIYLPGADASKKERGCATEPLVEYVLPVGSTAVLRTREYLTMPSNIAAFGFPPSHVSAKGLLITNPGHVDPGFTGVLEFTVINMSREPFSLRKGDMIVTLLIVSLSGNCKADYSQRNPSFTQNESTTQKTLDRLSADFLDVKNRAGQEARTILQASAIWTTVITAVVALVFTWVNNTAIGDIRKDVATMQTVQNVNDVKTSVDKIKTDVEQMKAQSLLSKAAVPYAQLQKDLAGLQASQDSASMRTALDAVRRDIDAMKNKLPK